MEVNPELIEKLSNLSDDKKTQLKRYLDRLYSNDLVLIKEIIINNPPTYHDTIYKKPKYDRDGKLITHTRRYLTANMFYADKTSYHVISKIIQEVKVFLHPFLRGLPELEKMETEMDFHFEKDLDLDNRWFFFYKLILDILKCPTPRQVKRAEQYKKPIISTNTIYDDNTKYVNGFNCNFIKGESKIVFRIYGRIKSQQKELNLFFI